MILIPLLAVLAWVLAFRRLGRDPLESAVAALVVFGLIVSFASELQSLTGTLTASGSAIVWTLGTCAGLLVARRGGGTVPADEGEPGTVRFMELAPVLVLLALTGFLALVAAPNSFDALTYHLVRVEQWVQQGSLRPFATHDTRQLFMPSWPEYAILQFRLLSGNDHFANLVQWIGFAGSCGGAGLLARTLGGGRPAAAIGAALVATLPMAVAQASGTQTDIVAAWWAVTTCALGYRLLSPTVRAGDALLSAMAFGLALATKQTAALFGGAVMLPAMAAAALHNRKRLRGWWIGTAIVAVALVAGPQLVRNWAVFGNLRGDPGWISPMVSTARGPNQIAGSMLRNLSVHFGTPWNGLNGSLVDAVAKTSRAMGADPDDPRTTWTPPFRPVPWSTHEEFASNPLHLLLLLGCGVALLVARKRGVRLLFFVGLAAGFIAFSALLKWQIYNGRLHTPLFALGLGWAAVELERVPVAVRRVLLAILFLAALPAALLNYTRPLLSLPRLAVTPRPSVLSVPRNLHYFMYMPNLAYGYRDVALRIGRSECKDIGVRAWPDSWEYPVMALARQAGSGARFRNVDVTNASARFATDPSPPCLLLQLGPNAGHVPDWASTWKPLADWHASLGLWGIALFAP